MGDIVLFFVQGKTSSKKHRNDWGFHEHRGNVYHDRVDVDA